VFTNYNIVGEIHGHAEAPRRLLHKMDYRDDDGIFRHGSRRLIFVGDLIDRVPQQREVLQTAKGMCGVGEALAIVGTLARDGAHAREYSLF